MTDNKKGPGKGLFKRLGLKKPKRITKLKLPTNRKSNIPRTKGVTQDVKGFAGGPGGLTSTRQPVDNPDYLEKPLVLANIKTSAVSEIPGLEASKIIRKKRR